MTINPEEMWKVFNESGSFQHANETQRKIAKLVFLAGAYSMLNRLPQVLATSKNKEETYIEAQNEFLSIMSNVSLEVIKELNSESL